MPDLGMPKHRPMMTVDLEAYSLRTNSQQATAQENLSSVLAIAAAAAGLAREGWLIQQTGDGEFSVLPGGTPVGTLAETFIPELCLALAAHNHRPKPSPWTRLRLRLALHEGPIRTDGAMGVPGGHAVQVNRLADAQAVRDALRLCPGADLAVIVSDRVFNDYLSDGYGSLSPAEFRQVHVRAKSDTYTAYLYVAGCDLHELADLDAYAPGPPAAEEPRPLPAGPGTLVYGSAHKITDSVVNETHEGDINVGDISLGGKH